MFDVYWTRPGPAIAARASWLCADCGGRSVRRWGELAGPFAPESKAKLPRPHAKAFPAGSPAFLMKPGRKVRRRIQSVDSRTHHWNLYENKKRTHSPARKP